MSDKAPIIFYRDVIFRAGRRLMVQMNSSAPLPDPMTERFLALLEAQKRTLYKVAYIYCRDDEDRRDLIQEMAVQLWRSFDRFDGRSSLTTWTWRVAMNVAISHRRGEGRRIRDALPLDVAVELTGEGGMFAPDDDRSKVLHTLIAGLDEMSRALVLLYLDGFDHAEIATMLGTSASNVATRLGRIKLKLQSQIDGGNA
jgi:RNA polymerase sigma-70 factor (ECF subfamily)